MAKPKDSEIEKRLRRVVRAAVKNGEEVTMRSARSRVEAELGLEEGFLKGDEKWKAKSKSIIEAVVAEDDEDEEEPKAPAAVKSATPVKASKTSASQSKDSTTNKQKKSIGQDQPEGPAGTFRKPPQAHSTAPVSDPESSDEDESSEADSENDEENQDGDQGGGNTKRTSEDKAQPPSTSKPKKPEGTATQVNGVKRKADNRRESRSSSSDSESEEDSSDDDRQAKKAKTSASSTSAGSSSEDEESSDDESMEDAEETTTKEAQAQAQAQTGTPKTSLPRIPSQPFEPPKGFIPLDPTSDPPNPAFSPSALTGKQIWHITAPSNIPLSSIKDVALDAIQAGTPVLTHNNTDYVLKEDSSSSADNINNTSTTVLIPTPQGYQRISHPVARRLNLQQKINLPNLSMLNQSSQVAGSSAAGQIAQPAVKSAPKQPKGLRMRYRPPGFGGGGLGRIGSGSESSEDEGEERPATFQFPRALGGHGTSTQQGPNDVLRGDDEGDGKRRKKRREKEREGVDGAVQDEVNGGAQKAASQTSQGATSPAPVSSNGVVFDQKESKEDRAKRKAERKLQKEAKRKSREAKSA